MCETTHTLYDRTAHLSYLSSGPFLTLGAHAQRGLKMRVTVLGLCVCLLATQHLTFHVIIRATNDTNLLSGG